MSKVDEMFEKLGYEKGYAQLGTLEYYKDDDNVIYFHTKDNSFHKSGKYDGMCDYITMPELQAINEKIKELGWE